MVSCNAETVKDRNIFPFIILGSSKVEKNFILHIVNQLNKLILSRKE